MNFSKRSRRTSKRNMFVWVLISLVVCIIIFLYILNGRILPTYVDYAEMQTEKVATYVVSKAVNARTTGVLDVNNVIEPVQSENGLVTIKFNTDIINRVRSETTSLVKEYLEEAEEGNLSHLPSLENVEYDVGAMQVGDGIVFLVPISQALNLPLIGNLGPKVPIRFHLIGNVQSDVKTEKSEIGINNIYIEIYIIIKVNVRFIVPFASREATVEQRIPVAIGLVQGTVPHIYTDGGDGAQPSIEVPIPYE